jgi:hypothetical protein
MGLCFLILIKPLYPLSQRNITLLFLKIIDLLVYVMSYINIAKSLANRVKHHRPNYIIHAQSAFIAHTHISSNVIITQEIIHSFILKSWNNDLSFLRLI